MRFEEKEKPRYYVVQKESSALYILDSGDVIAKQPYDVTYEVGDVLVWYGEHFCDCVDNEIFWFADHVMNDFDGGYTIVEGVRQSCRRKGAFIDKTSRDMYLKEITKEEAVNILLERVK